MAIVHSVKVRQAEIRTLSDKQAQARLERLIAAKRAGEEARRARYIERRECAMRHAERIAFERRRNPSSDADVKSEPSWLSLIVMTAVVLVSWFVFGWFVVRMIELFAGMK